MRPDDRPIIVILLVVALRWRARPRCFEPGSSNPSGWIGARSGSVSPAVHCCAGGVDHPDFWIATEAAGQLMPDLVIRFLTERAYVKISARTAGDTNLSEGPECIGGSRW